MSWIPKPSFSRISRGYPDNDRVPFRLYVVILLAFSATWSVYAGILYIGRDGQLNGWLALTQYRWSGLFDVTALDPFQGMGSMLMPINPWLNPGVWPLLSGMPKNVSYVLSTLIYFLEFSGSTYLLIRTLDQSRQVAFVSMCWATIIAFSPFCFVFGFQGLIATAPTYGNSLAIGNLMVLVFYRLGVHEALQVSRLGQRVGQVIGLIVLGVLFLIASPMWNAGLVPGYSILFVTIFLSSMRKETILWRGISLLSFGAVALLLRLPTFYLSAWAMSARFIGTSGIPKFNWSADLSQQAFRQAQSLMCAEGLFCSRFPKDYISPTLVTFTGSSWILLMVIFGGILAAWRGHGAFRRFAIFFVGLWSFLILYWWAVGLNIVVPPPPLAPLYIYLPFYPLLAMFSIYPVCLISDWLRAASIPNLPDWLFLQPRVSLPKARVWTLSALAAAAVVILCIGLDGGRTLLSVARGHFGAMIGEVFSPQSTDIIDYLEEKIALKPGSIFEGTATALYGLRGSPLRIRSGISDDTSVPPDQFERYLSEIRGRYGGNTHTLGDLWDHDIPTLEEYGQSVTIAMRAIDAALLSDPNDTMNPEFLFAHKANFPVLDSLGVRFIITDSLLQSPEVDLRLQIDRGGIPLRLYELKHPNLGTYSPTKIIVEKNARNILSAMKINADQLENVAFVNAPFHGALVPAGGSQMSFIKNGVHVTANSAGESALLLPLQFSHCLVIKQRENSDFISRIRANLAQTLLVFNRRLDVDLLWRFNFWRQASCRARDVRELHDLGL